MHSFRSSSERFTVIGIKALACAVVLLFALPLLGCSGPQNAGEGPPQLSPEAQRAYQEFQRRAEPYFFALSMDGRAYSYSYCSFIGSCTRTGARVRTINSCYQASNGVPCRIYANAGRIVWEGPAPSQPSALSKTAPPIPNDGPSQTVTLVQCKLPDGFMIAMVAERCLAAGGDIQ